MMDGGRRAAGVDGVHRDHRLRLDCVRATLCCGRSLELSVHLSVLR